MRYVRVRVRPPKNAHPVLTLLLQPRNEARLLQWNFQHDEPALLFHVDRAADSLQAEMSDLDGLRSVDVVPAGRDSCFAYLRPIAPPIAKEAFRTFTQGDIIAVPPIVYGDGVVRLGFIGTSDDLDRVFSSSPLGISLEVERIGSQPSTPTGTVLSDRQAEAIQAAFDLGYYSIPRQATHKDVAEALDCAPSTASEHLQKAEAALVRAHLRTRFGAE